MFEVRFSLGPDVPHATDTVWVAITSAFAFVLGRRVVVHGYEEITRDSKRTKTNGGSLAKCLLQRVEFVRSLGRHRPVDVLWAWQKKGMLGITPDDIEAWKAIRNPDAHGQFAVDSADWQRVLDRFHR